MFGKKRLEGLKAASLYGELTSAERDTLGRRLETSPEARAEMEALAKLVRAIPVERPGLPMDLTPALREQIAREDAAAPAPAWRVSVFAGASLAAALVFAVTLVMELNPSEPQGAAVTAQVSPAAPATPVLDALRDADALMAKRRYADAYQRLLDAVAGNPEAEGAQRAWLLAADLAFQELELYAEARDAYRAVTQFDSEDARRRVKLSMEVLDEAAKDNYETLYALNRASDAGERGLAQLEEIIQRRRGDYIASLAAERMARILAPGAELAAGLELAKQRATNPAVGAQLNYDLGNAYRDTGADWEKARRSYEETVASGDPVLAKKAQDALASLRR